MRPRIWARCVDCKWCGAFAHERCRNKQTGHPCQVHARRVKDGRKLAAEMNGGEVKAGPGWYVHAKV